MHICICSFNLIKREIWTAALLLVCHTMSVCVEDLRVMPPMGIVQNGNMAMPTIERHNSSVLSTVRFASYPDNTRM